MFTYLLVFGCAGSSLLRGFFCSCGEPGLPLGRGERAAQRGGVSCCEAQAPGLMGFSSCGSGLGRPASGL